MKVDIIYAASSNKNWPCLAKADVDGRHYVGVGKTWNEAKEDMIADITRVQSAEIPAAESVELELKPDWPSVEAQNDHWSKIVTEGLI